MRRNRPLAVSFLAALVLVAGAFAPAALALPGQETDALGDEAVDLLQRYLRVDTVNPPGNESRGVDFLAAVLEAEGIAYESAESAPGRGNIWARLEATTESPRPGLMLLHHIDVVPADREFWSVDPLGGEIRDGYLWGRGALDTKGLGILHLVAFLELHRSGAPRDRDVVYMATADEEAGGFFGVGWLVENRPEAFAGIGTVLNEGGGTEVHDGVATVEVEITQKVPLWLRLHAGGEPGHGSMPRAESAVTRLIDGLARLRAHEFEPRVIPATERYFAAIADAQQEPWRSAFADMGAAIAEPGFLARLQEANPFWHALTRNTCSMTILEGSTKINVVPPTARAELDCRLLPDQDPDAFVAELEAILADPGIRIERIMAFSPAVSDPDTDDVRALREVMRRHYDRVELVPGIMTGFTDSHFLRDLGIDAYGYEPMAVPAAENVRIHGNDERVAVDQLRLGARIMTEVVRELATPR